MLGLLQQTFSDVVALVLKCLTGGIGCIVVD